MPNLDDATAKLGTIDGEKKLKILSITPTYFPDVGGIESVVRELAVRMSATGMQVDVAHVSPKHPAYSVNGMDGINVYRIPVTGNRLVGYARGFGGLAAGYDLLHVHDPQLMMLTGNVLLQSRAIPAILSTHGGFRHTRQHQAFKWAHEHFLMRPLLSHYRRVLAVSQSDAEYFSRYSGHVDQCDNGIAFSKFQRGRIAGVPDPTKWIYWGRWSRNKRIDAVIDVVAQARDQGIAIDLLVAGPDFDHLGDSFKAKIEALQLGGSVKLHPYIEDDLLIQELQQRSVFITGSEYEGFGVGILEAMAAGKIVICRDMEPVNGFVKRDVNGFFLDFDGSAKDLTVVREVASLGEERCIAMSDAAQSTAKHYDWESVAERFSEHYARALGSR